MAKTKLISSKSFADFYNDSKLWNNHFVDSDDDTEYFNQHFDIKSDKTVPKDPTKKVDLHRLDGVLCAYEGDPMADTVEELYTLWEKDQTCVTLNVTIAKDEVGKFKSLVKKDFPKCSIS